MTALDAHREDGPVASSLVPGRLPLPGAPMVVIGAIIALLPLLELLGGVRWQAPWAWVLVGGALALLGGGGRRRPRLDWIVPALLRALEYGSMLLLLGATSLTYVLLAALAYRHYDIVYRERTRGDAPPGWLVIATGGWEVRTALVAGAAGFGAARPAAVVLLVVLVPVLLVEALVSWRSSTRAARSTSSRTTE